MLPGFTHILWHPCSIYCAQWLLGAFTPNSQYLCLFVFFLEDQLWVPPLGWHTKNHRFLGIYSSWQVGGEWQGQPVADWCCGAMHACVRVCVCVVLQIFQLPHQMTDVDPHCISNLPHPPSHWATVNLLDSWPDTISLLGILTFLVSLSHFASGSWEYFL